MAQEFHFKITGEYKPANTNVRPFEIGTFEYNPNQAGAGQAAATPNIGTSEETVTFDTDIGNAYWLFLRNLDATNFIDIGFSTGVYGMRLRPGDFAILPLLPTQASIFCLADTAAVDLQYIVYEE